MLAILVIFVIVISVIGIVALAFDVSALAAVGIIFGAIIVLSVFAFLINRIAKRFPRFGDFIGIHGFIVSLIAIGIGILMTIVGAFTDAGEEMRSYVNISGETVFYLANATDPLFWIGFVVAFAGLALFFTSFFILGTTGEGGASKVEDVLVGHEWRRVVGGGGNNNIIEIYYFHRDGTYTITKTLNSKCRVVSGDYRILENKQLLYGSTFTFTYSWANGKLEIRDKKQRCLEQL